MATPDGDWTDADFEPRDRPVGSVEELRTSLVERTVRDEQDSWFVEDLRLLVCVRLLQGRTEAEVEGELAAWGLEPEYAVDQIGHTRVAGHFGPDGGIPTTTFRGRVLTMWNSPSVEFNRQPSAHALRRYRLACALVGGLSRPVEDVPDLAPAARPVVDLGFTPEQAPGEMSPDVRDSFAERRTNAVAIALGLLAGAAAVVAVVYGVLKLQDG